MPVPISSISSLTQEIRRIIWPKASEVTKISLLVFGITVIGALALFTFDSIVQAGIQLAMGFGNGR